MDAILYAEVYLICVIIMSLLYLWSSRKQEKSVAELSLSRVFMFFMINFFSNFLFTLVNRILPSGPVTEPLSYALKSVYMVTLAAGVLSWCLYAELSLHTAVGHLHLIRLVLLGLLGVFTVLIVINLFAHFIFAFDENRTYRRYAFFHIYLLLLFLVAATCSTRLILRQKHELDPARKAHFRLNALFPLCIVLALCLTLLGELIPVICVCLTVALLCIFVSNLKHQISTDSLTRVNNRQNLNQFMTYKLRNHDAQLWMLMIDVDHFKQINDTYGHLEGDRALQTVSGALKQACRTFPLRPFIARYGGDEFVIVVEGTEEDCRSLTEIVRQQLDESCAALPYPLKASIGVSKYISGMSYEQLLEDADAKLYEMKAARDRAEACQPAT